MKPQPLRLAGIAAVLFGQMTSFGVGAIEQDTPTVTEGRVMTPGGALAESDAPITAVTPVAAATPDSSGDVTHLPARADESPGLASNVPASRLQADPIAAPQTDAAYSDPDWAPLAASALTPQQLDNMRGGFDLPSGLQVSFGIERVAFVNGNMVSTTSFNIPDIGKMTAQQAQALASASTGGLVQIGSGNAVQPGALPGLTGGVIQNTLSNQLIQALTTINTSVNSLGPFKAQNVGATINSALINAVRPR
ncbi:MAG: hypothetical protein EPN59_16550 [Paraburkholderia sp.]|uniref:hypothetical protein n=1 Tax=Paraburkholderia sp. TaxID=1926495 RepID=UPI00121B84E0|nr:hypothetical protein [Paraburkholderia sp.]TAM28313.1 MAG: hypothetical protein EPN59_16550 [Paraburkholderia sp.]